jgi:hypothetical protein
MENVCICCSLPNFPNCLLIDMATEVMQQVTPVVKIIDAYITCSGICRDVNIGTKICKRCLELLYSVYTFYLSNKVSQSLPIANESIKCVCCCQYTEQQVLYKVKTKSLNNDYTLSLGFTTFFDRKPSSIDEKSRICKECFTQLESIFMFREFCKNANEILKRRFINSQPKIVAQEKDEEDLSYDDGGLLSDAESFEEKIDLKVKKEKPTKALAKKRKQEIVRKQPGRKKKEEQLKEKIAQNVEKTTRSKRKKYESNATIVQTVEVEKIEEPNPQKPGNEEYYKDMKLKILLIENNIPLDVEIKDEIVRLGPDVCSSKPAKRVFKCALCLVTRAQKFDIKMHLYDAHFPDCKRSTKVRHFVIRHLFLVTFRG